MGESFDENKTYQHWIETSDRDFETMEHLYKSADYHWSLFIGHIVLEKLLKACVVKSTLAHAPFTHDLVRLAKSTDLEFSDEQLDWMDTITTFNINTRYDSYRQSFYLKCTPDFTSNWITKIKQLRSWIKEKQS
ncbi:HEPN domain-containing protein [Dyadobacter soli]|uniref:HEPN domain-containing protein n=1 Tax=Dyadobacter soli TaxID=659014 RepID=A0A1G7ITK9_9BACT|nr:HEPN domain-containing protein [Dyadobacter soli]SDF16021.1 HEPN domain-containing protein [Dyadobacter soli]